MSFLSISLASLRKPDGGGILRALGARLRKRRSSTARPALARADRGRVLERAADHVAALGRTQRRRANHAENQLGARLAGEHRPFSYAQKSAHVVARLVDDAHQLVRRRVIAALVVGDSGELGIDLDHRFQRQRTAGVLEENSRTLVRAGIDVAKRIADLLH